METKDTTNTQAVEVTENAKNMRGRIDELRELYRDGYVTENEFKVARVNILKEGGLDIVTQFQQQVHQFSLQEEEEEEEPKPGGCGRFLLTLLLAVLIILSVSFFAAPYWPNHFGGAGARAGREWFTAKTTAFIGGFFVDSPDSTRVPDPVSHGDERPAEDAPYLSESLAAYGVPEGELQDASFEPVAVSLLPVVTIVDQAGLRSLDMHVLSLPSGSVEQDVTAVEIQTPVSARPSSVSPVAAVVPPAENAVRGYVRFANVRIRSEPDTSTSDNIVGRGYTGDRFIVLEEGSGSDGSMWYNVEYEDGSKRGWVSGSLVRLEN